MLKTEKNDILKNFYRNLSHQDLYSLIDARGDINREIYIDTITPQVANKIEKIIRFWNSIDDDSTVEVMNRQPIKIYINSKGGLLEAAFTIIDAIKLSKTPVYTINTGTVSKEAFYIFLAGINRFSYPRASFFYKREESFYGIMEDEANYEAFYQKQMEELKQMILEKTKISEQEYDKKSTMWFTAEQAYENKICTEVLRSRTL